MMENYAIPNYGIDSSTKTHQHCVLMVSDFFYPSIGGVETHIWTLSQCLLRRGHKIVVLTHAFDDRSGIRYMTNGLKVYYAPLQPMFENCTCPAVWSFLPLFRDICIREGVQIVHGHQETSSMVHESMLHATTLGLRTIITTHSLHNIFDPASIHLNKLARFTMSSIDHMIAVSHTTKENIVTRNTYMRPDQVSTIPNAVDASAFTPDPTKRDNQPSTRKGICEKKMLPKMTIVVINRLAYRKGADLVAEVIPKVCAAFPEVNFVVAGDGPKRLIFDEMRERHGLHDRVELLGSIQHVQVRNVLCRGTIFLNCSLTEAFCMAILEAACCGLFVVSTNVGGISEVLAPDMIAFAEEPTAEAVFNALARTIQSEALNKIDPFVLHKRVKRMYDWDGVAARVVRVYDKIKITKRLKFAERLQRCFKTGPIGGVFAILVVLVNTLLLVLCRVWRPDAEIEECAQICFQMKSRQSRGIASSAELTSAEL